MRKNNLYFLYIPSEYGWFIGLTLICINCCDLSADSNSGHIEFEEGLAFQLGDGVSQDWSAARKKYQEASALGNHNGSHHLGLMYRHGDGVDKNLTTAVSWMKKAASQGSSDAMNDLGVYYKDGLGVDQNYTRAASWFRKGAELGNAFAQFNFALLHTSGLGVEIDLNKSTALYEAAAFSGYNAAQRNLGILKNMRGENTYEQIEAYAWLLIASINKDFFAPEIFRELASAMSPEEIDAGRRKATQFLAKSQKILNDWSPAPQAP
jgi:TPR repeat protein